MSNEGIESITRQMKGIAVMQLLKAFKLYRELVAKGWPRDAAWQFAFMGILLIGPLLPIKPLPKPDPPYFTMASLYEVAQGAYSDVCKLKESFEIELAFLETLVKEEQGEVPT